MMPDDPDHAQTHLPDEQHWQQFLQAHRPLPPPVSSHVESQLMAKIQQDQALKQRPRVWGWVVLGVVVLGSAGLGLGQWRQMQPMTAMEERETAELEAFLVDQWSALHGNSEESWPGLEVSMGQTSLP